jgi:hypothetical protein
LGWAGCDFVCLFVCLVWVFFRLLLLLLFIYLFVFNLIENFPLKNIARRYFVVVKKKTFTGQMVDLLQFYVEIVIFYPKSSLFSSTENAHFCYLDLARKL